MKKHLIITTSLILAVWLIWSPLASAQGTMPPEMPDRTNHRMEPPQNRRHSNGFDGANQAVNVSGTIDIADSITLSLTIKPSDDVIERMNNRDSMVISDFQNVITVSLTQLVEYNDTTNDGLTEDDMIISTFDLNDENLKDIVISELNGQTIYTIVSEDESFQMIIEINSTDNIPHDWKWSLEINYDYISDTSKLAVLHEIVIGRGDLIREDFASASAHPEAFDKRELSRSHARAPMFFRWDQTAFADDKEIDVEATKYNESLSLSFLQGDTISYDPSIGVSQESIESLDFELVNVFDLETVDKFIDQLSTPTARSLIIGILFVSTIAMATLISKSRSN
ncbi:MAG: hypothetical protein GPJ54_04940 [Candidatus Heimdallarchaeota archaeon]|nr:hypothetical protein [Candidatus Heimdallarchaeota archaeon]